MLIINALEPYLCSATTPIRNVVKRIDMAPYLFQMVVDDTNRLVGTITDGDIRRAILAGATLDATAASCMNRTPTVGTLGEHAANRERITRLLSTRAVLPIVDADGRVHQILVDDGVLDLGRAVVMAGGLGTRLGEMTRTTPKPMLLVAGTPILERILGALERAGFSQITISANYLAEQISDFIEKRASTIPIDIVVEEKRMGTAGSLSLIDLRPNDRHILVMNGDVVTDIDFRALVEFHRKHKADNTICVRNFPVEVPFGVVFSDRAGLFDRIEEKPLINYFVSAGVYILSANTIKQIKADQYLDMPDFLNSARCAGKQSELFPIHEYWRDVGQPTDLESAAAELKSGRNSVV